MKFPFLKQVGKIVAFLGGKPYTIAEDNPNYDEVLTALHNEADEDKVLALLDKKVQIQQEIKVLGFEFKDDILYYNGKKLHEDIALVIKSFKEEYGDFDNEEMNSIKLFIDNLVQNPSYEAMDDLFSFLQKGNLPITDDGHFLAYKKVRENFKDIYSGTIDNSPGKIVEMERDKCNLNRNETCSSGLHFCSKSYLSDFGNSSSKIIEVKINPKDVTSIPTDYNQAKGRCCKYLVIKEITSGDLCNKGIIKTEVPALNKVVNEIPLDKEQLCILGTKKCSKCHQIKTVDKFTARKDSKDGFNGVCKECVKAKKQAKKQVKERFNETKIVDIKKDTKVCSKCGVRKPKEEGFHKRKDSKDGYRGVCKECLKKGKK